MGLTNLRYGLEDKIASYRGEIVSLEEKIESARRLIVSLPQMMEEVARLKRLVEAAEMLITADTPTWDSAKIKPKKRANHTSPVPFGDLGRSALAILRQADEPMRTRDIARRVLHDLGIVEPERKPFDRVTNSLSNYLSSHEGDLVESEERYPKLWKVIRPHSPE